MDHEYIREHELVDRYLASRLSAGERVRFEDHFVDCPNCLDELELARDFQASLRAGVARRVTGAARLGILAWLARPAGRVLLLGAFAVLLVPAAWLALGPSGQAGGFEPQVNIPTYTLGAVRGDQRMLTAPAAEWLSLVLEVDGDGAFSGHRLRVRDAAGAIVLERAAAPDRRSRVAITFPPGSLPAGEYRLELEGLDASGRASVLSSHAFRLAE